MHGAHPSASFPSHPGPCTCHLPARGVHAGAVATLPILSERLIPLTLPFCERHTTVTSRSRHLTAALPSWTIATRRPPSTPIVAPVQCVRITRQVVAAPPSFVPVPSRRAHVSEPRRRFCARHRLCVYPCASVTDAVASPCRASTAAGRRAHVQSILHHRLVLRACQPHQAQPACEVLASLAIISMLPELPPFGATLRRRRPWSSATARAPREPRCQHPCTVPGMAVDREALCK
jgi:hypothetical protein